ncbi:MAG: TetR/AcrR family transcriptional regulator [Myxococcales bacterium]|nr:TetR/AcrR family transcriptional regulator [Myxococcales bacterium]
MADAARHKENLVRTAMRLFRRQGYASSGLQQILSESGAPKGSLYHYFPAGKEALGEAAVILAGNEIHEMLAGLAERHRSPAPFLRAYARTMAGWMEESGFESGCPIATTLLETAPRSPRIREAGERAIEGWVEVIGGVLARAGHSRAIARRRARLVVSAMEGALILARVHRSTRPILDVALLADDPR